MMIQNLVDGLVFSVKVKFEKFGYFSTLGLEIKDFD